MDTILAWKRPNCTAAQPLRYTGRQPHYRAAVAGELLSVRRPRKRQVKLKRPSDQDRWRRVIWSLIAAPALYGLGLLFEHFIEPRLSYAPPLLLVHFFGLFGLPLLAFGLPCAILAWYFLTSISQRFANRLTVLLVASLAFGALLFIVGWHIRDIYGLDPPYALFFLGASMQIAGPLTSLAALAHAIITAVAKRQRPVA
jgi:hypothetical protein